MRWTILGHRAPSDHTGEKHIAMDLVRSDGEREYNISASSLGGFAPVWGMQYEIEVISSSAPRLIDVAALPSLTFEQVVVEKPVPNTAFRIYNIGPPWLRDDRRSFIDGQAFACESDVVCGELDARVAQGASARFNLAMRHGAQPGDVALVAVEDASCRTNSDCRVGTIYCCDGQCTNFDDAHLGPEDDFRAKPGCDTP